VLLAAVLVALLGSASPAAAHAELKSTDPADGSLVKTAPRQVTLTFTEAVTLQSGAIRVFAPNRKEVGRGQADHAGGRNNTARLALDGDLPQGTFTVSWRAVSADSHPIAGAFTFSVGKRSAGAAPEDLVPGGGDRAVSTVFAIARWTAYASFALLIGASAFCVLCWPRAATVRGVQRLLQGSWAALLLATVAALLLYGPHTAGAGLGRTFDLDLLRASLDTRLGSALGVRLLVLAAYAVFLSVLAVKLAPAGASRPQATEVDEASEADGAPDGPGLPASGRAGDMRWALGLMGGLLAWCLAATWAVSDHAATGPQAALALPVDMIHLMSMALWLGGLAVLLVLLWPGRRGPAIPTRAVAAFSRIAFWCVMALVATGVYQAWRQTMSWNALVDTDFGRYLMIKAGAVAVLVAAAAASRKWTNLLRTAPDDGTATRPSAGAGSGTGTGAEAEATSKAEGTADAADDAGATPVPPSAKRRAQLERQRSARESAKVRRAEQLDPAPAMLRRSLLVEVGIAVAVLVVTTLLTNTTPGRTADATTDGGRPAPAPSASSSAAPRQLAPEVQIPFDTGGAKGQGTATVSVDPGTSTGANELHILFADREQQPMDVAELGISFTLKDKKIGPIKFRPKKFDKGHYLVEDARLPMAGRWNLALSVRTSEIDEVTEQATVTIR
jgi:copper transport protein